GICTGNTPAPRDYRGGDGATIAQVQASTLVPAPARGTRIGSGPATRTDPRACTTVSLPRLVVQSPPHAIRANARGGGYALVETFVLGCRVRGIRRGVHSAHFGSAGESEPGHDAGAASGSEQGRRPLQPRRALGQAGERRRVAVLAGQR